MTSHSSSVLLFFYLVLAYFIGYACCAQNLGHGIYLPDTNLISHSNPNAPQLIFQGNVISFMANESYPRIIDTMNYMESSTEVHRTFGASYGMSFPIKVLMFSFDSTFRHMSGGRQEVKATLIQLESYSRRVFFRNFQSLPLNPTLIQNLNSLPEPPSKTGHRNDWINHENFLKRWGSHYMTEVRYGSWMRQYTSASSTETYTHVQLKANACARLLGKKVSKLGACVGITAEQLNQNANLRVQVTTEVRGGDPRTAAQIRNNPEESVINKFLEEGRSSNEAVVYHYAPIWQAIKARYSVQSREWRQADALESFYNGFLAFSCPRISHATGGSTEPVTLLQEFRRTGTRFQCVRHCVGCRRSKDCNFHMTGNGAPGCYCYGNSCIVSQGQERRAAIQLRRDNRPRNANPNRSCSQSGVSGCKCDRNPRENGCGADNMIEIWPQSPPDPNPGSLMDGVEEDGLDIVDDAIMVAQEIEESALEIIETI